MNVQNPQLYETLRTNFRQEPEIINEDEPGEFSCPPMKVLNMGRKALRYAQISNWGETYRLNCPECGDTRQRLFVSNLYGRMVKIGNVKYFFGRVYKCHNEGCNLDEYLKGVRIAPENIVVDTKPKTFVQIVNADNQLPKNCPPINSSEVPAHVGQYLWDRGFDPEELFNKFAVRYAPSGTIYAEAHGNEPAKQFFDDRVLIPIIQGHRLVSWQARRAEDRHKDKYKYLNEPGWLKSKYLYNVDRALFHRDLVIVEGVTDVWRIGDNAVAIFGKKPSHAQMEMMRIIWGFNGRCVVCLDPDADVEGNTDWLVKYLRNKQIFPGGVGVLNLQGADPAEMRVQDIRPLLQEAFNQCVLM